MSDQDRRNDAIRRANHHRRQHHTDEMNKIQKQIWETGRTKAPEAAPEIETGPLPDPRPKVDRAASSEEIAALVVGSSFACLTVSTIISNTGDFNPVSIAIMIVTGVFSYVLGKSLVERAGITWTIFIIIAACITIYRIVHNYEGIKG